MSVDNLLSTWTTTFDQAPLNNAVSVVDVPKDPPESQSQVKGPQDASTQEIAKGHEISVPDTSTISSLMLRHDPSTSSSLKVGSMD